MRTALVRGSPHCVGIERVDRTAQALVGKGCEVGTADSRRVHLDHPGCDRLEGSSKVRGTLQHKDASLGRLDAEGAEVVEVVWVASQLRELELNAVAAADLQDHGAAATGDRPGAHWACQGKTPLVNQADSPCHLDWRAV